MGFADTIQAATADRPSLDEVLASVERFGGASTNGWHAHEPQFRCWHEWKRVQHRKAEKHGTSTALALGSLLHELLAFYYANREDKSGTIIAAAKAHGYEKEADSAVALYDAYRQWWSSGGKGGSDVLSENVVDIEVEKCRELPWGEVYTCRIDLVVKKADGYWLVDHKTTSRRDVAYVDGWQLDPQILGMFWVCEKIYKPLAGAIINGIVKHKEPEFDRLSFARDKRMVRQWLSAMKHKYLEKQIAEVAGWPRNFASCIRRFGKCRFFDECAGGK